MVENHSNHDSLPAIDISIFPVKYKKKIPFHAQLQLNLEYREIIKDVRKMEEALSKAILSDRDYLNLIVEANSTNIFRSLSYEAAPLSKGEVNRLSQSFINGHRNLDDVFGSSKDVLNHWYVYLLNEQYEFPWDLEEIIRINADLIQDIDAQLTQSPYITERRMITGSDGREYLKTCTPQKIEDCLEALLEWVKISPYDELLTSVIFYFEFMMMFPFERASGPTGRMLFQMLIQKFGLEHSKMCKLDRVLIGFSERYNDLIFYTETTSDYTPLIMHIAHAMKDAYAMALEEVQEKDLSMSIDEISRIFVNNAKQQDWFSVSESSRWVPGLTEQIARLKLNELVEKGVLEKEGKTRATRFRFKDPFRTIKHDMLNPQIVESPILEDSQDQSGC